ncbi:MULTISPECIES: hypothetical protein [Amycolatopsis]|uniref:hypothetical protein n=1 Tax=Amycolatopsis TaxID=1813 RepID=UPI00174D0A03|nr:hypothetical protein [Amycolatopsis bullii]
MNGVEGRIPVGIETGFEPLDEKVANATSLEHDHRRVVRDEQDLGGPAVANIDDPVVAEPVGGDRHPIGRDAGQVHPERTLGETQFLTREFTRATSVPSTGWTVSDRSTTHSAVFAE